MGTPREIFDASGPLHLLTSFDWQNASHQRSLAASLVQGVYNLEHDRQSTIKHYGPSSEWWETFHFKLNDKLEDQKDRSYFGAIYEHKYPHHPPRYVIAFRGTMIKRATTCEDMKLNIKCVFDELDDSPRFRTAIGAVWKMVSSVGPANVWLAGYSLGAAIAMLAGRIMAKYGYQLETYLFNPPYILVPTLFKSETLKHGVRIAGSLMTAGIATAMKLHHKDPEEDQFNKLSEWRPYLFVNPSDPICAEYIGYFEHREKMERKGIGKIERIATKHSMGSLLSGAKGRDSEPSHLLPTAYVTVNLIPSEKFKETHGIHQWWQQHYQWQSKLYKYN